MCVGRDAQELPEDDGGTGLGEMMVAGDGRWRGLGEKTLGRGNERGQGLKFDIAGDGLEMDAIAWGR